jgi:glutamyl-tRNA reductase
MSTFAHGAMTVTCELRDPCIRHEELAWALGQMNADRREILTSLRNASTDDARAMYRAQADKINREILDRALDAIQHQSFERLKIAEAAHKPTYKLEHSRAE